MAAEAAFAERGFHRTSVRDIAERAGVAAGTYYLYFPTKEASCLAVIDDVYRQLLECVAARRAGLPDVLAKLAASVAAAIETFAQRPAAARVVFLQAPGAHPAFDRRLGEIQDELVLRLAQDIGEAVQLGLVPPQDPVLVGRCLVGTLREVLLAWVRPPAADVAAGVPPLQDPRRILPDLLAFVLRGLGADDGLLRRTLDLVLPPASRPAAPLSRRA